MKAAIPGSQANLVTFGKVVRGQHAEDLSVFKEQGIFHVACCITRVIYVVICKLIGNHF